MEDALQHGIYKSNCFLNSLSLHQPFFQQFMKLEVKAMHTNRAFQLQSIVGLEPRREKFKVHYFCSIPCPSPGRPLVLLGIMSWDVITKELAARLREPDPSVRELLPKSLRVSKINNLETTCAPAHGSFLHAWIISVYRCPLLSVLSVPSKARKEGGRVLLDTALHAKLLLECKSSSSVWKSPTHRCG